jgi:phosphatidylglycerophosphate synthase
MDEYAIFILPTVGLFLTKYVRVIPNLLSASRYLLAIPAGWLVWQQAWVPAVIVLWIAIATDIADGYLARRLNIQSNLGGLLDHSSDAIFVTSMLAALASLSLVPVVLPIMVIIAFLQYMLDSKSLSGKPLRSSQLGRYNGICYFIFAGFPVMQITLGITLIPFDLFIWFGWGLVLSTAISMIDRLATLLSNRTLDE